MNSEQMLRSAAVEPRDMASWVWTRLRQGGREPTGVEVLKDRNASHVYRLAGAGPDGSNVIAKHCLRAGAVAERTIYQQVLRYVPVRSVEYYGCVEEPGRPFCWMFVEDAAGVPYTPDHGRLAAEWLASLHTWAQARGRELDLPERGPSWSLGRLRSARARIRRSLGNPALTHDDRGVLEVIVEQSTSAERYWRLVKDCCEAAPPTFVHADLHAKNIHVSPDGSALLPFDWETAGWGPPAIDLGLRGLDLCAYGLSVRSAWPQLEAGLLDRLAAVGRLFQLLAHVEREARGLASPWLHKPMKHMRYYVAELTEALRSVEAL